MDIHQASRSYETWVRRYTSVVRSDLRHKHARMRESPFVFLRATFYRWLQRWPEVCPQLLDAPKALAIGDLHIENFGTWRDCEGRLIWGVNDVDEVCLLPYTQDLVRLARRVAGWVRRPRSEGAGAFGGALGPWPGLEEQSVRRAPAARRAGAGSLFWRSRIVDHSSSRTGLYTY